MPQNLLLLKINHEELERFYHDIRTVYKLIRNETLVIMAEAFNSNVGETKDGQIVNISRGIAMKTVTSQ